ncbi:MAG: preprotein translocase subunit SecA, partial [Chloroflexi bacterium]|nr:preprotein translocase subunit SecA [Chloroflexota bacterium]
MFRNIVKKVLGDPMEKALSGYQETVDRINALEPRMQQFSTEQMKAVTADFKAKLANGASMEDLLPEAFALVREASVRTIGLRHYDVQLIGGIVLHEGRIAEMKTGEGKTLVATLPLYLNALLGQGAHLVTPNDYLSKHGLQFMGPIYHLLGLSAAVIQNTGGGPDSGSFLFDPDFISDDARYQNLRPISRHDAYRADILYGTNNEFGFDYLRDNMALTYDRLVQRALRYAIVDEVDNILIDEARTPLIISGPSDEPSDFYRRFASIVKRLKKSSEDSVEEEAPDGDYVLDIKDRIVYLTEQGVEKVETALGVAQLYHPNNAEMLPYLDNCLRAQTLFERDKEYIVQNGEVVIVDDFTGRLMPGRRFSEGLHQAI